MNHYDSSVNSNFTGLLKNVQDMFNKNNVFKTKEPKKITITDKDFKLLSKYEKKTLISIANIWGLLNKSSDLTFNNLQEIVNKLSQHKNDIEKHYLISLFFPEKVKNIHTIYPFPIPTYTYTQKYQLFVVPNGNGCFLSQVVCPLLLDSSRVHTSDGGSYVSGNVGTSPVPIWNGNVLGLHNGDGVAAGTGSVSNFYVNTNAALDGTTLGSESHFTPVMVNQAMPGAFNTYVLQCAKISAKYIGRGDIQSGIFGASYHLSPVASKSPDSATTQFNFVNDSINAVIADVTEGVNAVYYPPDYSYLNFLRVNQDNVAGGQMSTSLRLNLYGASLPSAQIPGSQSAGVVMTFVAVWNVIPSPQYAELLPLDYNIEEQAFDFLDTAKFVPQSNLITHKNSEIGSIERMLELPSSIRKQALNDYLTSNKTVGTERATILDILDPLVGMNSIPPEIHVDKNMFLKLIEGSETRKDNVEKLNMGILNNIN